MSNNMCYCSLVAEGRIGFVSDNVTVTEGTDDFATVTISFLSPNFISADSFADLQIRTVDGSANGKSALMIIKSVPSHPLPYLHLYAYLHFPLLCLLPLTISLTQTLSRVPLHTLSFRCE